VFLRVEISLVGTASADRSCVRGLVKMGFSLFLPLTDLSTAHHLADLGILLTGLADSYYWLEDSGLKTGSFRCLRESSSVQVLVLSRRVNLM
jgi:hypothetical protein